MTVRIKILALSGGLLLLFAGVLVGSVAMQRRTSHQVAAIIDFHLPLAAVIADLDVATYEFELIPERLLLLPEATPAAVEAGRRALDMNKARISADFERASALLERALVDPRTDAADRLVLARVQRSLVYLKRLQAPFFALGEEVVSALEAGRANEARALAPRFKTFEQRWGPDTAALRDELAGLARTSTESTYAQEKRVLRLNLLLFAIAAVLGLGVSAVGARRLVRALWRLLEGGQGHRGRRPGDQTPRDEPGRDRTARAGLQQHGRAVAQQ